MFAAPNPPWSHRSARHPAGVAVALLLAVAAIGCSTGQPDDRAGGSTDTSTPATSSRRSTDTSAPTTTTHSTVTTDGALTPADEAAILEAVDGYWRTIVEANDPPNPDHPGFDRYFTGDAKERSVGVAAGRLNAGTAAKDPGGKIDHVVKAWSLISPDSVDVVQCMVDDGVLVGPNGEVLDADVVTREVLLSLERMESEWRVSWNQTLTESNGATCDW